MLYVVSIDWLSLFCEYKENSAEWVGATSDYSTLFDIGPWQYKIEDYGTRHYKHLCRVSYPNEHHGYDEFAEVQYEPCSSIIGAKSVIVRFVNRMLYRPNFWELATQFLLDNEFTFKSISRVDICADFNDFATLSPLSLIQRFANKELRHIGRGVGALYFNHGARNGQYGINYTGLSFGTHSSDARVYLYNKSFELLTQGDKPWIKDTWKAIGLDTRAVWRLEVSLKSKACKFKDRTFNETVTITPERIDTREHLALIYHTFVRKLFSFVVNRSGITNITREPRIELFSGATSLNRAVIRNVTGASRLERILIKALYTMGDTYRGEMLKDNEVVSQSLAIGLAESIDLVDWMKEHADHWRVSTLK